MTLACADRCIPTQCVDDDLTLTESRCVTKCLHKYYRYLSYSNSLYTFLTVGGEKSHKRTPPKNM